MCDEDDSVWVRVRVQRTCRKLFRVVVFFGRVFTSHIFVSKSEGGVEVVGERRVFAQVNINILQLPCWSRARLL